MANSCGLSRGASGGGAKRGRGLEFGRCAIAVFDFNGTLVDLQ